MDATTIRPSKTRNVLVTIKVLEAQIKQLENSITEDGKVYWDLHRLIINELIDLETEGYPSMSKMLMKDLSEGIICGLRRAGARLTVANMISTGE